MMSDHTDEGIELETKPTKPVTQDHIRTLSQRPKLDYFKILHDVNCIITAESIDLEPIKVNQEITRYLKILKAIIIEVIKGTQDINTVNQIKGLIVHECESLFSQLISKLSLIKTKSSKNLLTLEDLATYKNFIDEKLREFLVLLDITINSEDTKEDVKNRTSITELLQTLVGFRNSESNSQVALYNEVPIQIEVITQTEEIIPIKLIQFYSIRTLVLNALQSLASDKNLNPEEKQLTIQFELLNSKDSKFKTKITITDNSSELREKWTQEFYDTLIYYYTLGVNDQTNTLIQSKGGAKLVAFLQGKRHRKLYHPKASPDEIVELGDNPLLFEMSQTGNTKSIILYF